MKNKNYLLGMCLLVSTVLTSQESQTTKAEKMGEGKFVPYLTNPSNGEYKFEGLDKGIWTVEVIPYETDLKQLKTKKSEESKDVVNYFPDNSVFPCTYVRGRLQTHKAMVGYKNINFNKEDRIVILDEWIYVLSKWKDKDHYVIDRCLKKGELKGMKLMKAAMGSKKEMENAKHVETLQKYLDEAYKKQAEMLVTTDGRKKNEEYESALAAGEKRWSFVIDSINGGYWNSPEGKAMAARNKKNSEANAGGGNKITIKNTGSKELHLYSDGGSQHISAGASKTFKCNDKIYYCTKGSDNTWNVKGAMVAGRSDDCGKTINVNSN
jgi:hypothetical protein